MDMKGIRTPSKVEKKVMKKLRGDRKKCPFCGKNLGEVTRIKYKVWKACKCKNCGKLILNPEAFIVW